MSFKIKNAMIGESESEQYGVEKGQGEGKEKKDERCVKAHVHLVFLGLGGAAL